MEKKVFNESSESQPKELIVSVRDVHKSFLANNGKTNYALNGISLDIFKGEVLCLLGPNGAGKTTLASILITLLKPSSGELLFEGKSAFDNLLEYRKQVGFCPQTPNLHPNLTIEENLYHSARIYGLDHDSAIKRSEVLLQKFRLEKYKDQYINTLSGGYKQRASIARTLIHSPKLILFDEPTVGLDPSIRAELWQEIINLKNSGMAVVLTTHYLDEAEKLADRVCIIDKGSLKYLATLEDLKKQLQKGSLEEILLGLEVEVE